MAARGPRVQFPPTERGYDFGEVASALQKSIRRGSEDEALYWAAELDRSGYSDYCWRRLLVICSEDVGLAEPHLPATIRALYDNYVEFKRKEKEGGKSSWRMFLVHAVLLLARAKKSRIVDHAKMVQWDNLEVRDIPDVALDKHTLAGKRKGRGWEHFFSEGNLLADPETGELTEDGAIPDPYREKARELRERQVTRVVKR